MQNYNSCFFLLLHFQLTPLDICQFSIRVVQGKLPKKSYPHPAFDIHCIAYIRYASLFCLDSIPRITKTEYNQNDVQKACSGSVSDNNHPLSLNCITHPKSIRRWGRLFFRQLNHSTHPCACLLIFRKKQTLILRPLHLKWGRTTGVAIAIIV